MPERDSFRRVETRRNRQKSSMHFWANSSLNWTTRSRSEPGSGRPGTSLLMHRKTHMCGRLAPIITRSPASKVDACVPT